MKTFKISLLLTFGLLFGSYSMAQTDTIQATILDEAEVEADKFYNSGILHFQNKIQSLLHFVKRQIFKCFLTKKKIK